MNKRQEPEKREKPIRWPNFFVFLNAIQIILSAFGSTFAAYITLALTLPTLEWPSGVDPLVRNGYIILIGALIYTFIEEFWWPAHERMTEEILDSIDLYPREPGFETATLALDKVMATCRRTHPFVKRGTEFLFFFVGTILSGFGDLIGPILR